MFRLAGHLKKSIAEIESYPASELMEWLAFSRIEPIGADRDDFRAAYIACMNYNLNRPRKAPAKKPSDFMFDWDGRKKDKSAEIHATMMAYTRAWQRQSQS